MLREPGNTEQWGLHVLETLNEAHDAITQTREEIVRAQAGEEAYREKGFGLEFELQALQDAEQQLENIIQKLVSKLAEKTS
jgi:hypothetical protein